MPALVDVVVHPQLVIGQRGFVAPAVRQHPVALVGQALVPQLFERPDHRFHVGQIECLVIVVEVDPPRLTGYVGPPFIGVAQHRFAAGVVECRDAHRVDLRFVGDAQLPLDLEFGGQPMGVPAEATLHLVATHGAIAGHDVFDVAGEQMPVVRQAIGERRTVVEHVFGGVGAPVDARPERVVSRPIVEDLEFQGRQVRCTAGRLRVGVLGHCASSP